MADFESPCLFTRWKTQCTEGLRPFQVVIDLIKNSSCFNAFTISADVLEIFLQQFWMILDICPRVEGVDFTDVPDDDATLAFLIKLGYNASIYTVQQLSDNSQILKDVPSLFSHNWKTVDVSEESEPEPKPVKRKDASRRVVKKLSKSISKTEAEEAEAARQVHATHARIVTESVPEPTRRRKSGKVTSDPPKKLKGVPSLTPKEQEAADTMQALKKSRKTSKR
ncbi:hypothetical protein Tco_0504988 [Tanacetum coccineum]|uniref:Uncharacterized protein n=1 Tax=Tanacetum coccineum TaxID=301880 RepID=A0ABQ5F2U5_9ASTR